LINLTTQNLRVKITKTFRIITLVGAHGEIWLNNFVISHARWNYSAHLVINAKQRKIGLLSVARASAKTVNDDSEIRETAKLKAATKYIPPFLSPRRDMRFESGV